MEPLPDEWSLSIVDTIGDIRHLRSEIAEARAARLAEPEVETEKAVSYTHLTLPTKRIV